MTACQPKPIYLKPQRSNYVGLLAKGAPRFQL